MHREESLHRPLFHFSPPAKWLNDPNGLVYYDGEYHLFYQHNPHDSIWGPMHWGHAVSNDLLHWQHLPIALSPDDIGEIYSGSVVIDWNNSAGFGHEAMVAVFTHQSSSKAQMQSLAFSTDKGRSWTKYDGNPVIDSLRAIADFRDPRVFWHEVDDEPGRWIMVVAAGAAVLFFESADLKRWTQTGRFSDLSGDDLWEMPDLFALSAGGGPTTKWVLLVSSNHGVRYFVGDFDGSTFLSDDGRSKALPMDYGADFYATQTWAEEPSRRRVCIAWMNNWVYANQIPTTEWRGVLSFPRQLRLQQTPSGLRLCQIPVDEIDLVRGARTEVQRTTLGSETQTISTVTTAAEITAEFLAPSPAGAEQFGLRLRSAPSEYTTIGYAVDEQTIFVDRRNSGDVEFHPEFAVIRRAPLDLGEAIRLQVLVDRCSIEVFANHGEVVLTEQRFPTSESFHVEVFAEGGRVNLLRLSITDLNADAAPS